MSDHQVSLQRASLTDFYEQKKEKVESEPDENASQPFFDAIKSDNARAVQDTNTIMKQILVEKKMISGSIFFNE